MSETKSKKGINPLMIVIVVLVLVIVGLAAYFLVFKKASNNGPYVPQPVVEAQWSTGEFIVNLADTDTDRYLKTTMVLTYDSNDKTLPASFDDHKDGIRDAIIRVMSERKSIDIKTNAGKDMLNTDIAKKVNGILGADKVIGVQYTDFLIQ